MNPVGPIPTREQTDPMVHGTDQGRSWTQPQADDCCSCPEAFGCPLASGHPGRHSRRGNHQVNRNEQGVSTIQLDAVEEETGKSRPFSRRACLKGHRYFRWVRLPACCRLECGIWVTEPVNGLATEPDKSLAPQTSGVAACWVMQSNTRPWYLSLLIILENIMI